MTSQPVRVALDLETTGLLTEQDSIIEIGAVKFAGDTVLDTFERFVAPRHSLPYRVQRLTGIRPANLSGAPALAAVAPELRTFLADHPLVGHSIPFDAAFLRRAGLARHNPLVDTYELASALLPNLPSYTLEAVGSALGIASPTYHRALADAQLSHAVFVALFARLRTLDTTTLLTLDRLSTSPDWTPGYFVRAELRARPDRASGTLGDQLAAKLGIDPAVLSLAIASPPRVISSSPPSPPHAAPALPTASASPPSAGEGLAEGSALTDCFTAGGCALVEVEPDARGYLASLRAVCAWVAATGEPALVVAADAAAADRVARVWLPEALAALDLDGAALPVAAVLESEAYLCAHRWFGAATLPRDGAIPQELARGLAKLAVWASGTTSGSRAEISLTGPELVAWERARGGREFADTLARCTYRRRGYCFVARAEAAAADARLIVTTHAALAADLLAARAGRERQLPDVSRVLVLDAHLLEDELRRAGSWSLERRDLAARLANLGEIEPGGGRAGLLHLAARRDPQRPNNNSKNNGSKNDAEAAWLAQVARAQAESRAFFAALSQVYAAAQRGGAESRGDSPDQALILDHASRRMESWIEVERTWHALDTRLAALARLAGEVAARLTPDGAGGRAGVDGVETDLLAARRGLEEVCARGRQVIASEREDTIAWLRIAPPAPPRSGTSGAAGAVPTASGASVSHAPKRANGGQSGGGEPSPAEPPTLHVAPVEVGALLAPLLAPGRALALVGTALAVAGEFDFLGTTLGLPAATRTHMAAPDYTARTLLLLPEDVPEPNAPTFQRHLDETIVSVAAALGGRTIVIFPSHAALRAAAAGIKRTLEARDVLVLAQGVDGSARQLWQTFRTQPRVVLLGAGAFWDGAPVEGIAPACVVVARLPFPSLSDPLLAARAATWPDQQTQFVVPHAALRVRQALNGLAWSQDRRVSVILFDRRLSTRGYGGTLLATLPRCAQRTEPLEQLASSVVAWVDGDPTSGAAASGTPARDDPADHPGSTQESQD